MACPAEYSLGPSRLRSPRRDSREREVSMFGVAKRQPSPAATGGGRSTVADCQADRGLCRDNPGLRSGTPPCWAACASRCRCWAAQTGAPSAPCAISSPCSARPARTLPGLLLATSGEQPRPLRGLLAALSRPRTGRCSTEFGTGGLGCRPPQRSTTRCNRRRNDDEDSFPVHREFP